MADKLAILVYAAPAGTPVPASLDEQLHPLFVRLGPLVDAPKVVEMGSAVREIDGSPIRTLAVRDYHLVLRWAGGPRWHRERELAALVVDTTVYDTDVVLERLVARSVEDLAEYVWRVDDCEATYRLWHADPTDPHACRHFWRTGMSQ